MNMEDIEAMPDPEPPTGGYPERRGLGDFRAAAAQGRVSWFKLSKCERCGKPIPIGFVYCDVTCHKIRLKELEGELVLTK